MTHQTKLGDGGGRGAGLALVGYRGTGKSTIGRLLASRLGRRFVDCDDAIETRSGRSISSIFSEQGEPTFRDLEARTLRELVREYPEAVLATGGGVVLRLTNRILLRDFGRVVWLQASAEELARRLEAQSRDGVSRPALTTAGTLAEIAPLLERRRPWYQEVADFSVDTASQSLADVVESILKFL